MLKKINANGVESDEGFKIQITGPEIIKYTCKNHSVDIEINYDPKHRKAYIYAKDTVYWNNAGGKIRMTEFERNLMIRNIKNAVKLLEGDFEVL